MQRSRSEYTSPPTAASIASEIPARVAMRESQVHVAGLFLVAADGARGARASLAFALPFELVKPLGRIGPLAADLGRARPLRRAGAVGAWRSPSTCCRDWRRLPWRRSPPATRASSRSPSCCSFRRPRAPIARPDAIKFALRNVGGIALYVAAANLLRAPRGGLDDGAGDGHRRRGGRIPHVGRASSAGRGGGAGAVPRPELRRLRPAARERAVPVPEHRRDVSRGRAAGRARGRASRSTPHRAAGRSDGGHHQSRRSAALVVVYGAVADGVARRDADRDRRAWAPSAPTRCCRRTPGRWQAPVVLVVLGLLAVAQHRASVR